ncbi:MAG: DUF4351 domain-containing protein [Acidobacteriota bacterium]
MLEYDTALKNVLQKLTADRLKQVTGFAVTRWHNVELPVVRSLRADLLGETAEAELVHIELQSSNDADMALRMAEYALAIRRRFGRLPAQVVLYVGHARLKMRTTMEGSHLAFSCPVVDIRELNAERWLESEKVEDNVVAILLGCGNEREAIRRILKGIAASDPARRPGAFAELVLLAGLRKIGDIIEHEARQMPILNDIMDHEVIGPLLRRGMELGRIDGRIDGERHIVLHMLTQRFGPVPDWAKNRIEKMSTAEIEDIAARLLVAPGLEALLL